MRRFENGLRIRCDWHLGSRASGRRSIKTQTGNKRKTDLELHTRNNIDVPLGAYTTQKMVQRRYFCDVMSVPVDTGDQSGETDAQSKNGRCAKLELLLTRTQ